MIISNFTISGQYPGVIIDSKEVKDGLYVVMSIKIDIPDREPLKLIQWYTAEPFWGSPLSFIAKKMGLLENDPKEIDFKDIIGKRVSVRLEYKNGTPKIRYIEPLADDVSGGDDIG